MEYNKKTGTVQSFMDYLPRAMKFYSLKNEFLARIVFVLVLAANILAQLYIYKNINLELFTSYPETLEELEQLFRNYTGLFLITVVRGIAVCIVSSFYLLAYIRELRGEPVNMAEITSGTLRKMIPYVAAHVVMSVIQGFGLLFFVIPGIILYILFLFTPSFIIDNKSGFLASFTDSASLTRGYRGQIFSVIAVIYVFFNLASMFLASFGSAAAASVVASFISTIEKIVTLRMVALMYVDLLRKKQGNLPAEFPGQNSI